MNEGITVGALLLLLGYLYDRYATYEISAYGGLAKRLPSVATLLRYHVSLALVGLPLLNGFVG